MTNTEPRETTEEYRVRMRQELAAIFATQVAEIRAATLTPKSHTDYCLFTVEPFDTQFGNANGYTYRVFELSVRVTRQLGARRSEQPECHVSCRAQRLTAESKPDKRYGPEWIDLPDELAAELLGRASVA